jgi:group I intron endonuclease
MNQHISGHCGRYFYSAIKKYGVLNFSWEIIDVCNTDLELDEKERFYIKLYNSNDKNKGYNMTDGGKLGRTFNKESRENLSKATKGRIISEETRKKWSIMRKGRKHSEETKRKMSEARKGSKHYLFGKHRSDETKQKLRITSTGKHPSKESRKKMGEICHLRKYIYNIVDPNGIIYNDIKSLGVFCEEHNLKYNLVLRAFFQRNQKKYKNWIVERTPIKE